MLVELNPTFKLEHDRQCMCQWDLNQRLIIENIAPGTQVHFNGIPSTPYVEDGTIYADVPNEVLQESGVVKVYAYVYDKAEGYTKVSFDLGVAKRDKPEDYDANIKFGDILNEINGEVVPGGISEKLDYLKQCLNTLYQSPPIKLMREVYGENKTLKELCEYVREQEDSVYKNVTAKFLKYEIGNTRTGFITDRLGNDESITYPNGERLDSYMGIYVSPKIDVFPESTLTYDTEISTITAGTKYGSPYTDFSSLNLIDFRSINFGKDDIESLINNNSSYGFRAVGNMFPGVYLPKCSNLAVGTLICNRFSASDCYIKNGIHLGKYVAKCYPEWLFAYTTIDDVSAQPKTPVYCDKDFYVNGTLYLEKLNIDVDILIELFDNLAYVREGWKEPTLSIGDDNMFGINLYLDVKIQNNAQLSSIFSDIKNDGDLLGRKEEICAIDKGVFIILEAMLLKGWVVQ